MAIGVLMRVDIIAVEGKKLKWVEAAIADYIKRLPKIISIRWITIPLAPRTKNLSLAQIKEREGQAIIKACSSESYKIALDERGENWSTQQFSQHLQHWIQTERSMSFIIGGPDGLSSECLKQSQKCWSLSNLTFPHSLVKVIVIEQIYRALSILNRHPYHRGLISDS